ncbi:MAG: hypothetical protein J5654_09490 [Victivallales bacterium]|nr:hypothetical protein [Victivallales bacterium]
MPAKPEVITDSNIVEAIERLLEARGISAQTFAREIHVSPASLVFWRRKGNAISTRCWERLFPHIMPFLPPGCIRIGGNGKGYYTQTASAPDNEAPILTEADLLEFRPVLESVASYAHARARVFKYIDGRTNCDGLFFFHAEKARDNIPSGSQVLCRCSQPPAVGSLVVCAQDGEINVGRFQNGNILSRKKRLKLSSPTLLATIISFTVFVQPFEQNLDG